MSVLNLGLWNLRKSDFKGPFLIWSKAKHMVQISALYLVTLETKNLSVYFPIGMVSLDIATKPFRQALDNYFFKCLFLIFDKIRQLVSFSAQ